MNFSVLMSVYHKENPLHLNQSLLSIWDEQILKPNEIVLVEDGPLNDGLYDVIEQWQNKIPSILKRIKLDKNLGTGKAKNIGLKHCSHSYIAIMDSDDISLPERFLKQISCLKENPQLAILGCQMSEFIDNIENVVAIREVPTEHSDIIKFSKYRSPFNNQSIIYRKDMIENVGGYQHHLFMEDYNLFLRVISKGTEVKNLPDILIMARVGNDLYRRRRGIQYIKSEWQLAKLKSSLKIQNKPAIYSLFLFRSLPRLLPGNLLRPIYYFLRK